MKRQLWVALLLAALCLCIAACGRTAGGPAPDSPARGASLSLPPEEEAADPTALPGDPAAGAPDIPEYGGLPVSQTSEGWTLTLTRAEGDKYRALFTLELTAPEGTALDADNYFLSCVPLLEGGAGGGWGIRMAEDDDPADNRITFLLDMSCDSDIRGAAGMLDADKLEAIYYSPEHRNDRVVPVDGAHWQLPFRVESREDTVVYRPGQTVELGGCAVTVETVEAGPLSIVMELTGSGVRELRIEAEFSHASLPSGSIGYRFLDRSGQTIHISGGQTVPHGSDAVTIVSQVEAPEGGPIDPAGAAVLVLGGTEIPLEN